MSDEVKRKTYYLPLEIAKQMKVAAALANQTESAIATEAFEFYLKSLQEKQQPVKVA